MDRITLAIRLLVIYFQVTYCVSFLWKSERWSVSETALRESERAGTLGCDESWRAVSR